MTVAENIGYGLKIRKMPPAESKARVAEMLAMMQIERLADRRITQLSGGSVSVSHWRGRLRYDRVPYCWMNP